MDDASSLVQQLVSSFVGGLRTARCGGVLFRCESIRATMGHVEYMGAKKNRTAPKSAGERSLSKQLIKEKASW